MRCEGLTGPEGLHYDLSNRSGVFSGEAGKSSSRMTSSPSALP